MSEECPNCGCMHLTERDCQFDFDAIECDSCGYVYDRKIWDTIKDIWKRIRILEDK